jgi:hypothetical protein
MVVVNSTWGQPACNSTIDLHIWFETYALRVIASVLMVTLILGAGFQLICLFVYKPYILEEAMF